MEIKKSIHWYSAHRLHKHNGPCKNLHGHTYKLEVSLRGNVDEKTGMIIDFGDLKQIMMAEIHGTLDHALLLCKDDPMAEDMEPLIQKYKLKHLILDKPTTAENIAEWIHGKLSAKLPKTVFLDYIQVWETETSSVVL